MMRAWTSSKEETVLNANDFIRNNNYNLIYKIITQFHMIIYEWLNNISKKYISHGVHGDNKKQEQCSMTS